MSVYLNDFCEHLYIPHDSPDDGLSGPKNVLIGIIKIFVCVAVTPSFLFVNTRNRMQHHKATKTVIMVALQGHSNIGIYGAAGACIIPGTGLERSRTSLDSL
jgi:hypothetical protein